MQLKFVFLAFCWGLLIFSAQSYWQRDYLPTFWPVLGIRLGLDRIPNPDPTSRERPDRVQNRIRIHLRKCICELVPFTSCTVYKNLHMVSTWCPCYNSFSKNCFRTSFWKHLRSVSRWFPESVNNLRYALRRGCVIKTFFIALSFCKSFCFRSFHPSLTWFAVAGPPFIFLSWPHPFSVIAISWNRLPIPWKA